MSKPKPVVVTTICSLCGLDWERHGEAPTTEDCIRLLRAELASRPTVIIRDRFPVPYVQPWIPPTPWWSGAPIRYDCSTTTAKVDVRTPAPAAISCSSVAA